MNIALESTHNMGPLFVTTANGSCCNGSSCISRPSFRNGRIVPWASASLDLLRKGLRCGIKTMVASTPSVCPHP